MNIKRGTESDFVELGQVMFDAVHDSNSPYSLEQRNAWVAAPRKGDEWVRRLQRQIIFVAQVKDETAGFMTITPNGYLDFAYVRPRFQRQGWFKKLFAEIESWAIQERLPKIDVHASLAARPAFEAVDFQVVHAELVNIGDQQLERFLMTKSLD